MKKIFAAFLLTFLFTVPILASAQLDSGGTTGPCIGDTCPPPGGSGSGNSGGSTGDGSGSTNSPISFKLPNPIDCTPSGEESQLQCILLMIIRAITIIAAPIVVLMILIGAFQIMTSGGNSEKFEQGKKTITYAIIGFVLIILASSFVYVLQSMFQK